MMEDLMKVPAVATRLGKATKTIYKHIETGVIPPELVIRLNGSVRMKRQDLENFIESNRGK